MTDYSADRADDAPRSIRMATVAMYTGAVLSLLVIGVVILDQAMSDSLAGRMADAWPAYSESRLDKTKSATLTWLFIVGAAGTAVWLYTAWAAQRGKAWSRIVAPAALVVFTAIALVHFTEPFPPVFLVAGLLPNVAGLVAVVMMWTRASARHFFASPSRGGA